MPRRVPVVGFAVLVALVLLPVAANACLTDNERQAIRVKRLQTEFMVAALVCDGVDHRTPYNRFVRKFTPELVAHGKALRAFFARRYDGPGSRELDAFVTRMANRASLHSIRAASYCDAAGATLGEVLELEPGDLAVFSADHVRVNADAECAVSTTTLPTIAATGAAALQD